jgi:hypothetical protein
MARSRSRTEKLAREEWGSVPSVGDQGRRLVSRLERRHVGAIIRTFADVADRGTSGTGGARSAQS